MPALIEVSGADNFALSVNCCLTGNVDDARAGRDRDVHYLGDIEQTWGVNAVRNQGASSERRRNSAHAEYPIGGRLARWRRRRATRHRSTDLRIGVDPFRWTRVPPYVHRPRRPRVAPSAGPEQPERSSKATLSP